MQSYTPSPLAESLIMSDRKNIVEALSDFKLARDALVHAGDDEFIHQLQAFLKQIDHNPLCRNVLSAIPHFDVEAWLKAQIEDEQHGPRHLDALDFPIDKSQQLAIFVDLARSFASNNPTLATISGFGSLFGKYKRSEAISIVQSVVLRPFAEELTRRLRESAMLANPDIRDLAGVPLSRIPKEDEVRIFLSHKWANKAMVRRYHSALQQIGFDPWLDEEAIAAGQVLHRALDDGMSHSCAAVFFVTPEFRDDRWISQEVDLAINRAVERGTQFRIVTLVFGDAEVPRPLQRFVYAKIEHDIDGLREIIRALPIELGPPRWRESIVETKKGA
jgi:hypothetical protein